MKEIKEHPNKFKDILCTWIRSLSIVKMPMFFKVIYTVNTIQIKISAGCFVDVEKLSLKITLKTIGTSIVKNYKKEKLRGTTLIDFRTHHKTKIIETVETDKNMHLSMNGVPK